MAYNATYDTDDLSAITVDVIAEAGVQTVSLAALIAIALILTLMIALVVGLTKRFRK